MFGIIININTFGETLNMNYKLDKLKKSIESLKRLEDSREGLIKGGYKIESIGSLFGDGHFSVNVPDEDVEKISEILLPKVDEKIAEKQKEIESLVKSL